MTIEEKAKAYDHALEILHKYDGAHIIFTQDLKEEIFPELNESEDERIRKEIIEYFKHYSGGDNISVKFPKWIAYLEKQKAKERLDRMAPIYNDKESFESALENAWKYYNESASRKVDSFEDDYIECVFSKGFREGFLYREKQKEQKPVEPSDDELQRYQDELYDFKVFAAKQAKEHHISFVHDFEWNNFCAELLSYFNEKQKPVEYLSKRKIYDIMNKLTELSTSDLIPIKSEEYVKIHEITSDVCGLLDYPIEQKPAEKPINWTELTWKDIVELECIINKVNYEFRNGIGQESFGKEVLEQFREYKGDEYLDEIEQKPAEWSEADEVYLQDALWCVKQAAKVAKGENNMGACWSAERWLKSLRPQPHWKPSEEQMEALDDAILFDKTVFRRKKLVSLLEDLRKLK